VTGPRAWQTVLLALQPPLSLAYLFAMRAEQLPASFLPLMLLAAFPVAALVGELAPGHTGRRRALVVALAFLEILWTIVAQVFVGFAIALRSG
jgi:hypothetical protein